MKKKRFSAAIPLVLVMSISAGGSPIFSQVEETVLVHEDFEGDLTAWSLVNSDSIEIILDPGDAANHVLQLTPEKKKYTHAIFEPSRGWRDYRIEGRFLFPEEGDGYLGFIYNYQERDGRKDFGCIYVKSNGNYIRVSPHHDGNPSWRLYEELKVELTGEQRIEVGRWYRFRLDVDDSHAALYLVDMETPARTFDWVHDQGAFGLEARPGGGAPVWVDDVVVTRLDTHGGRPESTPADPPEELLTTWEIQGPFEEHLDEEGLPGIVQLDSGDWRPKSTDPRGAVVAALDFDTNASNRGVVYLRAMYSVSDRSRQELAISTVNRLHVWLNWDFVGAVEPESYIWSDFLTNPDHAGTRLEIDSKPGNNEIIIRLDGERFAGGGFFLGLVDP